MYVSLWANFESTSAGVVAKGPKANSVTGYFDKTCEFNGGGGGTLMVPLSY